MATTKPKAETVQHSLYNGEVVIDFYPNSHRYRLPNEKKWCRSVTSITGIVDKPALKQWAVDCAIKMLTNTILERRSNKDANSALISLTDLEHAQKEWENVSQEAKDIGTDVHNYLQSFIAYKIGGMPKPSAPLDEKAQRGVLAFLKWHKENQVDFIHSEKLVYSRSYDYVGTFDVSYVKDGKKWLSDFKTSKAIYGDYINQVVGYVIAYEEEHPEEKPYGGISILRFDKETGDFQEFFLLREDPVFEQAKQTFLACLQLKNSMDHYNKILKAFFAPKEDTAES